MFSSLRTQLFKDESLLDDARYIAVATGRLEPYKRTLAQENLFFASQIPLIPDQLQTENDATVFLRLWATRSRAKNAGLKKVKPATFLRIYNELQKTENLDKPHSEVKFNLQQTGILLDAGLANEIYIEPTQISEVYDLSQHLASPAAFTPIARESLELEQSINIDSLQLPEPLKTTLPASTDAKYCRLKLNGLHGESWNLLFLEMNQDDFDALQNLQMRYPQWLIIPQNCRISWINDILEEYRPNATPISLENHA